MAAVAFHVEARHILTLTVAFGVEPVPRFGGRFTAQLFLGDTLTGTLVVKVIEVDVIEVSVVVRSNDGVVVFTGSGQPDWLSDGVSAGCSERDASSAGHAGSRAGPGRQPVW